MAQNTSPKVERYTGTRITVHSSLPFDKVVSKLYSSIGTPAAAAAWPSIAKKITSYSGESRDQFTSLVKESLGPHDFMIFQEFDHGAWIPLFGVGDGLKEKRIILGNPLIAITMLKRDLIAGLAVPVELLVLETKGSGVDLIYQLPSTLIAGLNRDEELVKAVEALDAKLAVLVQWVASEKSGETGSGK